MKLILESIIKNSDGIIDVGVFIQNERQDKPKRYTYHLNSEYLVRKFSALYKKGIELHGRALQILVKNNVQIS